MSAKFPRGGANPFSAIRLYISSGQRIKFPNTIMCLSPKIVLVLVNSVDFDEMMLRHFMGLHCFPK